VLQARIPEQLDEELRERSAQLGLSVSTIVRNVLLNTFDLVEGVVIDSAQVGRALQGRGAPVPPPGTETPQPVDEPVVAWQEGVLNLNGVCEDCNTILTKGSRAAVGMPSRNRSVLLCLDCLAALSQASSGPGATGARGADAPEGGIDS
jgi:hypothetical protein